MRVLSVAVGGGAQHSSVEVAAPQPAAVRAAEHRHAAGAVQVFT
jgi:hypothetical protein